MNLGGIAAIRIPEGGVKSITVGGRRLWQKPASEPYTELAYIESTGTQYIDTGIIGRSGIEIYLDYEFTQITTTAQIVWGAINNETDTRIYVGHTRGLFGYGVAYATKLSPDAGTRYKMHAKLYKGDQTITVNGEKVNGGVVNVAYDTGLSTYMFANNATGKASNYCYAKIYSCKILVGGTLVRDFVPCRRNSDGAVGMYDRVTETFFGNLGTGEFVAGEVA